MSTYIIFLFLLQRSVKMVLGMSATEDQSFQFTHTFAGELLRLINNVAVVVKTSFVGFFLKCEKTIELVTTLP